MASGFFVLLDDIAVIMDDVALMGKIATKKTAGILGDDLAVNAEKASGFESKREIPVLWQIAKGSFVNKLILLPLAFLLSAYIPIAIIVILILGAIYLAYEGAEKIYEYFFPHHDSILAEDIRNLTEDELLAREKVKVKSAIVTDFILSAEIVIVALGTVLEESLSIQIMVVSFVALVATIGVYGLVALLVRMDDLGYRLIKASKNPKSIMAILGMGLVKALPLIIKSLAIIGTIALLLVAGGIFVHNIDFIHHLVEGLPTIVGEFLSGLVIGFIALFLFKLIKMILPTKKATT